MNQKRKLRSLEAAQLVHVVGGDNTVPLPWAKAPPKPPAKLPQ